MGRVRQNIFTMLHASASILPGVQSIAVDEKYLNYDFGERRKSLDLADSTDLDLFDRAKTTILAGYGVRSWSLFSKHQSIIRESLSFKAETIKIAEEFVKPLRSKYDVLIGILIRQGDYRDWSEGKYFFKTDQYIHWMQQAKEIFGKSATVGFIVASDETQNIEKFRNLEVHFATGAAVGVGHYTENMVELSKCDLIMSVPSTFSTWAAFVGDIPLLPLWGVSQTISSEDLLKNNIFDALVHPHMSLAVH